MAKSRSNGVQHHHTGFLKSLTFRKPPVEDLNNFSPSKDICSRSLPTMASPIPLDSARESSTTWKKLFSWGKPDSTAYHPPATPSSGVRSQCQSNERYMRSEAVPRVVRGFSLKGNISIRDLSKSTTNENTIESSLSGNTSNSRSTDHFNYTPNLKSKIFKSSLQIQHLDSGKNLPLYRVYSQAMKFSRLPAPVLSADSIIRYNNRRRTKSTRGGTTRSDQKNKHNLFENIDEERISSGTVSNSSRSGYRLPSSSQVTKAELTQKFFVLLTSGYLLQYSGTGRFDRKPEKCLQLCKDSVAFASDAIPGKFWVLQVSQTMSIDGGTSSTYSQYSFPKLNLRGQVDRRNADNLLLVFDGADEFESWITVLRSKISALRNYNCDQEQTPKVGLDKPLPLIKQPCHKYILPEHDVPPSPAPSNYVTQSPKIDQYLDNLQQKLHKFPSNDMMRNSFGHNSSSFTSISQEDQKVESWNGSQYRSSYMSSGRRTTITSLISSPNSSPTLSAHDESHSMKSVDPLKLRSISHTTLEEQKTSPMRKNALDSSQRQGPTLNEIIPCHNLPPLPSMHRRSQISLTPTTIDTRKWSEHNLSNENKHEKLSSPPFHFVRKRFPEERCQRTMSQSISNDRAYHRYTQPNLRKEFKVMRDLEETRRPKHISSEPCLGRKIEYYLSVSDSSPTKLVTINCRGKVPTRLMARPGSRLHCEVDQVIKPLPEAQRTTCSRATLDQSFDDVYVYSKFSNSNTDSVSLRTKAKSEVATDQIVSTSSRASDSCKYITRETYSSMAHRACLQDTRFSSEPNLLLLHPNDGPEQDSVANSGLSHHLSFPCLFNNPPLPPPKCALPPLPPRAASRKHKPRIN